MKIPRRSEVTYNIHDDCIKIIKELSGHFDVSESRIVEICINHPNDFIKYLDMLKEKGRIKKEADHIDKLVQGILVQDEIYNQKDDSAEKVGESKWKDEAEELKNRKK